MQIFFFNLKHDLVLLSSYFSREMNTVPGRLKSSQLQFQELVKLHSEVGQNLESFVR